MASPKRRGGKTPVGCRRGRKDNYMIKGERKYLLRKGGEPTISDIAPRREKKKKKDLCGGKPCIWSTRATLLA